MDHAVLEIGGHECCPGLGEGGGDDLGTAAVGVRDQQLGEEALVGQAAGLGAAEPVDLVHVGEEIQGGGEGALDALVDELGSAENALGLLQFPINPFVLFPSEITGERVVRAPPMSGKRRVSRRVEMR
jgi:hypothetical protein